MSQYTVYTTDYYSIQGLIISVQVVFHPECLDTDSGSQTERTTFQDDGNLNSSTENSGKQFANALNTNVEFKKEKGKVWFHFTPSYHFNKIDETGTGSSETYRTRTFVNSSDNTSHRLSSSNNTGLRADVTFRCRK